MIDIPILRLEDGMELFLLPLPTQNKDEISYYQRSEQIWINNLNLKIKSGKYFFNNNNIFDKIAYMSLKDYYWKNRMKNNSVDNLSFADRFYSYVLYDNELRVIWYGHKIKNIVDKEEDIYDKFYYFKKLMIKIKKTGQFNNYDDTYFTDKYYNINENNPELIFEKLKQDKSLENILNKNSFSNNQEEVFKLFNTLGLMDLKLYIRRKKLEKLKSNYEKNKSISM